jgi:hypothetical protein
MVIEDIKSSCVYRAAGSIFSGICTVEIPKIPIEAGSRRPDLLRPGTVDDSGTTGINRIRHDGHHLIPAWCRREIGSPRWRAGSGVAGVANASGKPNTKPSIARPNRLYCRHLFERAQCSDISALH